MGWIAYFCSQYFQFKRPKNDCGHVQETSVLAVELLSSVAIPMAGDLKPSLQCNIASDVSRPYTLCLNMITLDWISMLSMRNTIYTTFTNHTRVGNPYYSHISFEYEPTPQNRDQGRTLTWCQLSTVHHNTIGPGYFCASLVSQLTSHTMHLRWHSAHIVHLVLLFRWDPEQKTLHGLERHTPIPQVPLPHPIPTRY